MRQRVLLSILAVVLILFSSFYIFNNASENHNFERFENYGSPAYLTPILVLVNSTIYPKVLPLLNSLEESMQNANYFYYFIIKNVSGKNPEEIREIIKEEYESKRIVGAVLIGNVPLAKYEDKAIGEVIEFPYYYMDLNGEWKDTDGDGIIDTPTGNYFPDIWVGIVRSTDENGNNVTQIKEYINKTIDYIDGKYYPRVQSGAFIDDDFLYLDDKIKSSLTSLYVGEEVVDQNTNSTTFLKFLSNDYAYAYFIAHSDGKSYIIKTPGGYKKVYPEELTHINALFYTDFSCYAASFERGAIANYLIMSKNSKSLGVLTYTAEGSPEPLLYYHMNIGEGMSFGKALVDYIHTVTANKTYFDEHIAMLAYLGFPFLKPWRPSRYKELRTLDIRGNEELLNYASKYGWKGNGTKNSPIRISHIMIFQTTEKGDISLSNITLYVELSDCWILGGLGINVVHSENVVIKRNKIYYAPIVIVNSKNIKTENNLMESYGDFGCSISVFNSTSIDITHNTINNGLGIGVRGNVEYEFNNGTLTYKHIYYSKVNISYNKLNQSGIYLFGVANSTIFRNDVEFKGVGLSLEVSNNNLIEGNNFTLLLKDFLNISLNWENVCYLSLSNSYGNRIYLNNFMYKGPMLEYIDFSKLVCVTSEGLPPFTQPENNRNYWNNSKYGNYWEWWANKNNTNDKNNDGIVDYPYVIDANNTDYKPLKHPFVWKIKENSEFPYVYITAIAVIVVILLILAIYFKKRR
ncbi:Periplasmic copper-binding protein (NosD) [Aciduliprofundum boonei T469]|nr:Periplasmic copper-binding protein (NosD) [Aciduliprofundum boonei T469]